MTATNSTSDQASTALRRITSILADTFTFVRSIEANRAIAAVTLDQLIADQIRRNGQSDDAKNATYDPYSFDPSTPTPQGTKAASAQVSGFSGGTTLSNFASGSDTNQPTKIARITALKNQLTAAIADAKALNQSVQDNFQDKTSKVQIADILYDPSSGNVTSIA